MYKVIVRVEFKRGTEVASDLFVHEIGAKGNREDRYVRSNLTTNAGRREYNWYGTNPTDPNDVMHRELIEQDSPQRGKSTWLYIEERYKYGEKDSDYRAVCRKIDARSDE